MIGSCHLHHYLYSIIVYLSHKYNNTSGTLIQYASKRVITDTCHKDNWSTQSAIWKKEMNDSGIYMFGDSFAWVERVFSRGCKAFTIMLMFGRNSASYCTHSAATAAIFCKISKQHFRWNENPFTYFYIDKKFRVAYISFKLVENRIKGLQQNVQKQVFWNITVWLEDNREYDLITFATDFEGYSPFSLTSTHCFTLSSLSFGVAW